MKTPAANLIDYLEYRKVCGDRTVDLEPETAVALARMAKPDLSAAPVLQRAPAPAAAPATAAVAQKRDPPGVGHPTPMQAGTVDFIFVGEQEGIAADRAAYSELLRKMVLSMGYDNGQVVFTNVCIGRKGQTPPSAAEMSAAMPAFKDFLSKVNPRGMVILGNTAALGLLGKSDVSSIHGQLFHFAGIPAIPTFHPAYMCKFPMVKPDACRDLCKALKSIGLPPTPALARFQ